MPSFKRRGAVGLAMIVSVAGCEIAGPASDHARRAAAAELDAFYVAAFRDRVWNNPPWSSAPVADDAEGRDGRRAVCLSTRGPDVALDHPEFDPSVAVVRAVQGARIDSYPASACALDPAPPHGVRIEGSGAEAVLVWVALPWIEGDRALALAGRYWHEGRVDSRRLRFVENGRGWHVDEP